MPESGLKRKVGPLPVWGWLGALGLGLVLLYWRSTHPATAQAAPDTASQDVGTAAPGSPGEPGPTPGIADELGDLLAIFKFGTLIAQQSAPPAPKVVHNCPRGFSWHAKKKRCLQAQKVCPGGYHWSFVQGRCVRKPKSGGGSGGGKSGKRRRGYGATHQGSYASGAQNQGR